VLRTRFENFLLELERHKQEKIDELQNLTSWQHKKWII
jgi:hypothetical protein